MPNRPIISVPCFIGARSAVSVGAVGPHAMVAPVSARCARRMQRGESDRCQTKIARAPEAQQLARARGDVGPGRRSKAIRASPAVGNFSARRRARAPASPVAAEPVRQRVHARIVADQQQARRGIAAAHGRCSSSRSRLGQIELVGRRSDRRPLPAARWPAAKCARRAARSSTARGRGPGSAPAAARPCGAAAATPRGRGRARGRARRAGPSSTWHGAAAAARALRRWLQRVGCRAG